MSIASSAFGPYVIACPWPMPSHLNIIMIDTKRYISNQADCTKFRYSYHGSRHFCLIMCINIFHGPMIQAALKNLHHHQDITALEPPNICNHAVAPRSMNTTTACFITCSLQENSLICYCSTRSDLSISLIYVDKDQKF